jgi:hypothetical protein
MKDSTNYALLQALMNLLEAHRSIFRQERTYLRALGLLISELFVFARHTVTQELLALGLTDADWSAWYRLFSRERFDPERASDCLFAQTLEHVDAGQPYVIGIDTTVVERSSLKMPGSSWLKAARTAPFLPGIARAQRFLNVSWLTPIEAGYSRAIPLRWLPAFPAKAIPADTPACKDWQAGLQAAHWARERLDHEGRAKQKLLLLVDGSFEKVVGFWKGLPERTLVLGRTARNRVLYALPQYAGVGRPPSYGERAPKPADWLKVHQGWQSLDVQVRGKARHLSYRVAGPYLREGLPDTPVFLLVLRGIDRKLGQRRVRRDPAFYLVSAVQQEQSWVLPLPAQELLAWAWQRWELEVQHREIKSGFGLGDKQCWNRRSAVTSVQWSAWAYAVLLLAGYRTWGLCHGPTAPGRWWRGSQRWSFTTLWRAYRAALWGTPDFRAVWTATGNTWLIKGDWIAGLWNSVAGAAR